MKTMSKRFWAGMMVLAGLCLLTPRVSAASPTKEKVLADLSSAKEGTVIDGLAAVEKYFPTDQDCITAAKKYFGDPRPKVARKAAFSLGNIHVDVTQDDLDKICKLLDSKDKTDVVDTLKGLRGLKAQSTVPKIVPLLQNPDSNVKRDACRTLAVLGDKSLVPSIEPLLKDTDSKVEADAADAINILKLK